MSEIKDLFASRLRAARENKGWSQTDLATKAGLLPSAISHFESDKLGSRKPSFDNLRKLSKALEVTTDYLLGIVADPTANAAEVDPLYRDVVNLTPEDRKMASNFLKLLASQNKDKENE